MMRRWLHGLLFLFLFAYLYSKARSVLGLARRVGVDVVGGFEQALLIALIAYALAWLILRIVSGAGKK